MKEETKDRRIRKTKAQIKNALTRLLMQKDLKDISVSEIADMADINRGTFYLHYRDVYDLFERTENDILENFTGIIAKHRRQAQIPLMPVILEMFRYVAANSDIFIAILRTKETTFLSRVVEMCRPQDRREWEALTGSGNVEDQQYYYSFIAFGCIALLHQWFQNGMAEQVDYMAAMAERLVRNCSGNKNPIENQRSL